VAAVRGRSWGGSGWLVAVVLLVVSGCGVAADEADTSASVEVETLVRRLPEATVSVVAIDAVAGAEALGADRTALGRRADLPAAWDSDGPDPDGQLGTALLAAITPLIAPFDSVHDSIDLGQVTGVVRATTTEPRGGLIAIATAQSRDELVAAYTDAGFEPAGDEVLALPGAASPGDASGGFPVLEVSDGLLVLATATDILDRWEAATGPSDGVLDLLAAAGERWAISIQLPPQGAASCGAGVAIVSDGDTDELLLLDAGADRLDRTVAEQLSFQIGDARPDGAITRYPLTPSDPTPASLVTGNVLADSPPLTSC
jgi:hypothetical protein